MVAQSVFGLVRKSLLGAVALLSLGFFVFSSLSSVEIGSVLRVQQKVVNVNVTADACLLDSESMWGTRLRTSPYLGGLKRAFERVTHSIYTAIKENAVPCENATIVISLFPSIPIQGRQIKSTDEYVQKYTGQAGCGIYILSDWQAKRAKSKTFWDWVFGTEGHIGSWHLIPFATDELLRNISFDSKANELQRFAKMLKIAAPLYVPPEVQRVTFGDAKCRLERFWDVSQKTDLANRTDIVTLAHLNRFGQPLKDEFIGVRRFMRGRNELPPVKSDIDRLEEFLGEEILNKRVDLADIVCMTWQRSEATMTLSRRWFWYAATFSMRGQLIWNPALFDCGEGLSIKYLIGY